LLREYLALIEGKGGCGENSGPDQTSKNKTMLREGFNIDFTCKNTNKKIWV
jgi:hypothetical protein